METTIGSRFNGERLPAWRQISGVRSFADRPHVTVTEAFAEVGLDYDVTTAPLYAQIAADRFIEVPGKRAVYRPSTDGGSPKLFGTVGANWTPLQNSQLAKFLDPLLGQWTLDAVGVLDDGENVLVVLRAPSVEVNGEEITEYFWVRDAKNGTASARFQLSPIRMHCTNQLITGFKNASFAAQVTHNAPVESDATMYANAFQMLESARAALHQTFHQMGQVVLTKKQIAAVIEHVFPDPKVPKKVQLLGQLAAAAESSNGSLDESLRATMTPEQLKSIDAAQYAFEFYQERIPVLRQDLRIVIEKFNDEQPSLANTGWAVYNAAAELADFRSGKNSESVAQSVMFGPRATEKEHAFAAVMDVVAPGWASAPAPTVKSQRRQAAEAKAAERAARPATAPRPVRLDAEGNPIVRAPKAPRLDAEGNPIVREPKAPRAPRVDADGNPIDATTRAKLRAERDAARLAKQVNALEEHRAKVEARVAAAQARIEARAKALAEREAAIAASNGQPTAAAVDGQGTTDPVTADQELAGVAE